MVRVVPLSKPTCRVFPTHFTVVPNKAFARACTYDSQMSRLSRQSTSPLQGGNTIITDSFEQLKEIIMRMYEATTQVAKMLNRSAIVYLLPRHQLFKMRQQFRLRPIQNILVQGIVLMNTPTWKSQSERPRDDPTKMKILNRHGHRYFSCRYYPLPCPVVTRQT